MPTCSTDDGIWCCSRCDISSPHIAWCKWLRCRCVPRCVLCEVCSHAPCPCCGAMEDGQLVELDDDVTFSESSTFVSDITDESRLADVLWQILSQARNGLSTDDLQKACGLKRANDLIAVLSRWEMEGRVVFLKHHSRVQTDCSRCCGWPQIGTKRSSRKTELAKESRWTIMEFGGGLLSHRIVEPAKESRRTIMELGGGLQVSHRILGTSCVW